MATQTIYNIGDIVTWKGAGKIARIDGYAGKMVTGIVRQVCNDGVIVEGHFSSLTPCHLVPLDKLRKVRPGIN